MKSFVCIFILVAVVSYKAEAQCTNLVNFDDINCLANGGSSVNTTNYHGVNIQTFSCVNATGYSKVYFNSTGLGHVQSAPNVAYKGTGSVIITPYNQPSFDVVDFCLSDVYLQFGTKVTFYGYYGSGTSSNTTIDLIPSCSYQTHVYLNWRNLLRLQIIISDYNRSNSGLCGPTTRSNFATFDNLCLGGGYQPVGVCYTPPGMSEQSYYGPSAPPPTPVTSADITTAKMTTAEMTTAEMTTAKMTTAEMTTAKMTTAKMTTAKMTTAEMTTAEMTTAEMTTAEMTTAEMTTAEMTTAEMTTAKMTTAKMTTAKMTTAKMTTAEMTTAEMTTAEMTTAEMTTAEMTSAEMTSAKMTTAQLTSAAMTTSEITPGTPQTIAEETTPNGNANVQGYYIGQRFTVSGPTGRRYKDIKVAFLYKYDPVSVGELYLFDHAFTGTYQQLVSSTDYLAKATADASKYWIFPSNFELVVGTYYGYAASTIPTPVSISLDSDNNSPVYIAGSGSFDTNARRGEMSVRAGDNFAVQNGYSAQFVVLGSYIEDLTTSVLTTAAMTTGVSRGSAHGDPMIVGFNALKFWFNGWAGGYFNIYHDEFANINSLFGLANKKNGTVMEMIAVETSGNRISFNINDPHDSESMSIVLNGVNTTVHRTSVLHLSGCVEIGMKPKYLSIRTPVHDIKIKLGRPTGDGYITVHHLDLDINPPKKNLDKVGGVIGQTAGGRSDRDDSHFSASGPYGTEKSPFYKKSILKC